MSFGFDQAAESGRLEELVPSMLEHCRSNGWEVSPAACDRFFVKVREVRQSWTARELWDAAHLLLGWKSGLEDGQAVSGDQGAMLI